MPAHNECGAEHRESAGADQQRQDHAEPAAAAHQPGNDLEASQDSERNQREIDRQLRVIDDRRIGGAQRFRDVDFLRRWRSRITHPPAPLF
jgi:hypothetical protein